MEEELELRCQQCGGREFSNDGGLHSVCVRCGMESQDTLNVGFDDWEEERGVYEHKNKLLRRRDKKEKKVKPPKRLPPEPSVLATLEGLEKVLVACGEALLAALDVDVRRTAERLWTAVRERCRACDVSRVTVFKRGVTLTEDDELYDAARMETVLGVLYLACRVEKVGVPACDVERWAWNGVLPYLGAWRVVDEATQDLFKGRSHVFRPPRVPLSSTIVLVAELRLAKLLGISIPKIDAAPLCGRFVAGLGLPPTVTPRAERLARLADARTEIRVLSCVVAACLLRENVARWRVRIRDPPVPWTTAQAGPITEDEYLHYAQVCDRVVGLDFDDATAPIGAATVRVADDLARLCSRALRRPPTGPLFAIGHAVDSDLRPDVPTLVDIASRHLACPACVFQQDLVALLELLDDVARANPQSLRPDLQADLDDVSSSAVFDDDDDGTGDPLKDDKDDKDDPTARGTAPLRQKKRRRS